VAAFDGAGKVSWNTTRMAEPVGARRSVRAVDAMGPTTVEGHFFRYDHLPGGWFVFPEGDVPIVQLELDVDGSTVTLTR
jgi:hypothetical protein